MQRQHWRYANYFKFQQNDSVWLWSLDHQVETFESILWNVTITTLMHTTIPGSVSVFPQQRREISDPKPVGERGWRGKRYRGMGWVRWRLVTTTHHPINAHKRTSWHLVVWLLSNFQKPSLYMHCIVIAWDTMRYVICAQFLLYAHRHSHTLGFTPYISHYFCCSWSGDPHTHKGIKSERIQSVLGVWGCAGVRSKKPY